MIRARKFYLHSVRCSALIIASILETHVSGILVACLYYRPSLVTFYVFRAQKTPLNEN